MQVERKVRGTFEAASLACRSDHDHGVGALGDHHRPLGVNSTAGGFAGERLAFGGLRCVNGLLGPDDKLSSGRQNIGAGLDFAFGWMQVCLVRDIGRRRRGRRLGWSLNGSGRRFASGHPCVRCMSQAVGNGLSILNGLDLLHVDCARDLVVSRDDDLPWRTRDHLTTNSGTIAQLNDGARATRRRRGFT